MRLMLVLILIGFNFAQSIYLSEEEFSELQKGKFFHINYDTLAYLLYYDIWQDRYILENPTKKHFFNSVDNAFKFFKNELHLSVIFIQLQSHDVEHRIFLLEWIEKLLKKIDKRKLIL